MLKWTKEELGAAGVALESLRSAKSGADVRASWTDLLDHLEKVWNKAKLETKAKSGPVRKRLVEAGRQRKSDELLAYMSQARHNDPAHVGVNPLGDLRSDPRLAGLVEKTKWNRICE